MKDKGEFFRGLSKAEQEQSNKAVISKRGFGNYKWECEKCGCLSDAIQEVCPNGCEKEESLIDIVRRFYETVKIFCEYHLQDDYDHCELCLKKEFTEMKKAFWEVKEKVLKE